MARADEIGTLLRKEFPGLRVTSTVRTRAEQDDLIRRGKTRARNSQHVSGTGIDVVLPKGVSPTQVRSFLRAQGIEPGEFINESGRGSNQGTGAHLHIGLAPKAGQSRAPAEGGDRPSRSNPAARVRQWRQDREAGPDVSQFPDLREAAATRLKPSTPIPPEVLASYNSHQMDDHPEDRAAVEKYVKDGTWFVPKGQRLQKPAPRTVLDQAKMYGRAAVGGLADLADTTMRAINPGYGLRPAKEGGLEFNNAGMDVADAVSDAVGAPLPESDTEKLRSAIVAGATQGLVTGPIGGLRGVAGRTAMDVVSGGAAGAASESARQAGAGPVGQVVAGLAGGLAPVGPAVAVGRIRAGRTTPRTLPDVVAETPRAAVIDEAGNLTPDGQEIAARHNVTPEQIVEAYEAPPAVQRGVANDEAPPAVAREATNDAPVSPAADDVAAPTAGAMPETPARPTPEAEAAPIAATPESVPATARERVGQAQEFGVDMTRGQATKNFDIQDRETQLRNAAGAQGDEMRAFVAKQTEQVNQAAKQFQDAIGDTAMTTEQRGELVQEALRDLRDLGQQGVSALYKQARDLGEEIPLETVPIRNTFEGLMAEADIPEPVKKVMEQEAARYGLIGEPVVIDKATGKVTNDAGVTTVKLDDGSTVKFRGEPQTLRLDNAEEFRKVISKQYPVDGPQKLTQELKRAIDDAVEAAAVKSAEGGDANISDAMRTARKAHVEQQQTFKSKDIVQDIVDWKRGAEGVTSKLKPDEVMRRALANVSDLKRVKAALLSKPTVQSKAVWQAIKAHGVAEIFQKAITQTDNKAGEITQAVSGAKLRSEIEKFGHDKLKVLLDPDQFNQLMKLRRVIEDVTVPISGTVNHFNSTNLAMRLLGDVDRQVTAAFSAAGFAIGGPGGAAAGGVAGREIGNALKASKQAREAAETLRGATGYTAEQAATDSGQPKPSPARKAASAVKSAGTTAIKTFIDTYASPRILAPVLASTAGAEEE